MSEAIHQEILFQATAERVYQALVDEDQFAELSGAPAEIRGEVGGSVSCFGGQVIGRIVELEPNRRVVQAWRVGPWDEGVWSIVRFELEPKGAGTRLTLDHAGFPDAARQHLEDGWHKMYWEPLRRFLS